MLDELRARSLDQWYAEGIYRPDVYLAGLLICRAVCQVGRVVRVRWAGVLGGGREAGASGSVSALPV